MSKPSPIQITLTEEQQAQILAMTGEHAKVLELMPESGDATCGTGAGLTFNWRLSVETQIPRLQWHVGNPRGKPPGGGSPA